MTTTSPDQPCVVALDVGGTVMKGGFVAADGTLLHAERRRTGREAGTAAVVARILDFAADLAAQAGAEAVAAGVVIPGIVDEPTGTAVWSTSLGWRDLPLRALLAERLGIPVALGHDVRAGGLAEGRIGAAAGCRNFLFVPLGTGLASALVLDGRPYAGAGGRAGEIGHLSVRPGGRPCACGGVGCLETVMSGPAVARAYAEAAPDATPATAEEVAKLVVAGDAVAQAVWDDAVSGLADGLLAGLTLYDPALVVIGGGLACAGDTLFAPLRKVMAERATVQALPEVVAARLGDEAGCRGAGLMAWDVVEGR